MTTTVRRLCPELRGDFFRVLSEECGGGWCWCVAWWVPTWQGFGQRSSEENRLLREQLFARGEYDGYLLYLDDSPIAWCQVGPRDRLEKLRKQYGLSPAPDIWAVSCFHVAPAHRKQGMAARLLDGVLEDLAERGVEIVEAFPRRSGGLPPYEVWTGPESLFQKAGFVLSKETPAGAVYACRLDTRRPTGE